MKDNIKQGKNKTRKIQEKTKRQNNNKTNKTSKT